MGSILARSDWPALGPWDPARITQLLVSEAEFGLGPLCQLLPTPLVASFPM